MDLENCRYLYICEVMTNRRMQTEKEWGDLEGWVSSIKDEALPRKEEGQSCVSCPRRSWMVQSVCHLRGCLLTEGDPTWPYLMWFLGCESRSIQTSVVTWLQASLIPVMLLSVICHLLILLFLENRKWMNSQMLNKAAPHPPFSSACNGRCVVCWGSNQTAGVWYSNVLVL